MIKEERKIRIKTAPFSEEIIEIDMNKCDFIYQLQSSKKRHIKEFINEHKLIPSEKIVYVHRYPKNKDTLIGIKILDEYSTYIS